MSTLPLEKPAEGGRAAHPYECWCPERGGSGKLFYAEGPSQAAEAFAVAFHDDWNQSPGPVFVADVNTRKTLEFYVRVRIERHAHVRWVRKDGDS